MLAMKVLGFWLVMSVGFFLWRRLTTHEARVSHVLPESRGHRA